MHYLLIYDVSADYIKRRGEFRQEHLKLAWESHKRGELILGGALDNPVDSAILLFQGDSSVAAEEFAIADPYVRHGLVLKWRVRPWKTVVGTMASSPVMPTE
jgi:uncharacterized protein